jgi:hypothetical protein
MSFVVVGGTSFEDSDDPSSNNNDEETGQEFAKSSESTKARGVEIRPNR